MPANTSPAPFPSVFPASRRVRPVVPDEVGRHDGKVCQQPEHDVGAARNGAHQRRAHQACHHSGHPAGRHARVDERRGGGGDQRYQTDGDCEAAHRRRTS